MCELCNLSEKLCNHIGNYNTHLYYQRPFTGVSLFNFKSCEAK